MKQNIRIGWHGKHYWTGLFWNTRLKIVAGHRCVGSGLTIAEAEEDLNRQAEKATRYPLTRA